MGMLTSRVLTGDWICYSRAVSGEVVLIWRYYIREVYHRGNPERWTNYLGANKSTFRTVIVLN